MVSKLFASFVLVASVIGSTNAIPVLPLPCPPVHIIGCRASGERSGAGIIGDLVDQVQRQSSQRVSSSSVDYPATLTDYAESSSEGTANLKTLLTSQVNRCPNQKIVLVGYSQGAHIIGDALAGGGGTLIGPKTQPISSTISDKVIAVVQMGDPRWVPGKSYNRGTARTGSLFPRTSDQEFSSTLAPRIRSYCDDGDTFCASGSSLTVHLTYLNRYQDESAAFILGQIGG
ncbi:cutinase [Coprinopsis sp. MPI-PUGE-AT-0042]|nr:cutinase [Coprinopsis sp. MPI-PUGE-AT-0042]